MHRCTQRSRGTLYFYSLAYSISFEFGKSQRGKHRQRSLNSFGCFRMEKRVLTTVTTPSKHSWSNMPHELKVYCKLDISNKYGYTEIENRQWNMERSAAREHQPTHPDHQRGLQERGQEFGQSHVHCCSNRFRVHVSITNQSLIHRSIRQCPQQVPTQERTKPREASTPPHELSLSLTIVSRCSDSENTSLKIQKLKLVQFAGSVQESSRKL